MLGFGPISSVSISDLWASELRVRASAAEFSRSSTTSQFISRLRYRSSASEILSAFEQYAIQTGKQFTAVCAETLSSTRLPYILHGSTFVVDPSEFISRSDVKQRTNINIRSNCATFEREVLSYFAQTDGVYNATSAETQISSTSHHYSTDVIFSSQTSSAFTSEAQPCTYRKDIKLLSATAEFERSFSVYGVAVSARYDADTPILNRYYDGIDNIIVGILLYTDSTQLMLSGDVLRFGEVIADSVVVGETSGFNLNAQPVQVLRAGARVHNRSGEFTVVGLSDWTQITGAQIHSNAAVLEAAGDFSRIILDCVPPTFDAAEYVITAGAYKIGDGSQGSITIIVNHYQKLRQGLILDLI